jgi:hypothetical protein
MLIIKILGAVALFTGFLITFSLYFESDYQKFSIKLIFGPILITLGIMSMKVF